MTKRPYQICARCIMDTTDPDISFDESGICSHCRAYEVAIEGLTVSEAERQSALDELVSEIKSAGRGRAYDCIIGVSGGVDSTYVAYLVKTLGLRPLAVHMDNGWDSELAVSNIEKFLKVLDVDLHTHVLDWQEFRDLQIAFLNASVPDGEIPTDHAIWAVLFQVAAKHRIRYILSGFNLATEYALPRFWAYGHYDWRYIKSVQQAHGTRPLKTFPHMGYFTWTYYYPHIRRIQVVNILDYVTYNKQEVMQLLQTELGWRPYGGKHYESIYTRFFQGYILPRKFGIDKRRLHISTMIWSGQMSRAEGLGEIAVPPYAGYLLEEDMEFVLKKFGYSETEFASIMALPARTFEEFPNNRPYIELTRRMQIGTRLRRLRHRLSSG